MLTTTEVDAVCEAFPDQLHRVAFPGLPARRTLYISEKARLLIEGEWPGMDSKQKGRWLAARAVLESFVDGRWMTVKSRPKSRAEFAILCPHADEIWEIRDVNPRPSLRILGSFATKDVFVALDPYERSQLGAKGSVEWANAIQDYKEHWDRLFNERRPMTGSSPDDYLSYARYLD